jgi:cell fate regulator YaaT (PSP1 superfamily)
MTEVLGVRFERTGKAYYFSPNGLNLNPRDWVVVQTSQGLSLGQVVTPVRDIPEQQLPEPSKPVLRLATSHDLLLQSYYQAHEARALERCRE